MKYIQSLKTCPLSPRYGDIAVVDKRQTGLLPLLWESMRKTHVPGYPHPSEYLKFLPPVNRVLLAADFANLSASWDYNDYQTKEVWRGIILHSAVETASLLKRMTDCMLQSAPEKMPEKQELEQTLFCLLSDYADGRVRPSLADLTLGYLAKWQDVLSQTHDYVTGIMDKGFSPSQHLPAVFGDLAQEIASPVFRHGGDEFVGAALQDAAQWFLYPAYGYLAEYLNRVRLCNFVEQAVRADRRPCELEFFYQGKPQNGAVFWQTAERALAAEKHSLGRQWRRLMKLNGEKPDKYLLKRTNLSDALTNLLFYGKDYDEKTLHLICKVLHERHLYAYVMVCLSDYAYRKQGRGIYEHAVENALTLRRKLARASAGCGVPVKMQTLPNLLRACALALTLADKDADIATLCLTFPDVFNDESTDGKIADEFIREFPQIVPTGKLTNGQYAVCMGQDYFWARLTASSGKTSVLRVLMLTAVAVLPNEQRLLFPQLFPKTYAELYRH